MTNTETYPETYNYKVVRQFSIMTIVWGLVGMSVGVLIASQLAWPALNFDIPWLTFGRLRPLHTNAVIFAFGGCSLFACSYYVVQHTSTSNWPFRHLPHSPSGVGRQSFFWRQSHCRWGLPAARNTPNWNGRSIF